MIILNSKLNWIFHFKYCWNQKDCWQPIYPATKFSRWSLTFQVIFTLSGNPMLLLVMFAATLWMSRHPQPEQVALKVMYQSLSEVIFVHSAWPHWSFIIRILFKTLWREKESKIYTWTKKIHVLSQKTVVKEMTNRETTNEETTKVKVRIGRTSTWSRKPTRKGLPKNILIF